MLLLRRYLLLICLLATALMLPAKTRVEIAQDNSPAVVAVNILKTDGTTFTATGFIVTPDGVVATNRHVLTDMLYLNLTFNTGALSGPATLLASSEQVDLALLKISARDLPTVELADSDYVLPGQEITVIGNPRRLQNTVSSGLISQVRKKADGTLWHQISAPISPSSSGSPVFNEQGQVVSVAFSTYKGEGNQNLNFSVPSNYLIQLLNAQNYYPPVHSPQDEIQAAPRPSYWQRFKAHVAKSWQIFTGFFKH